MDDDMMEAANTQIEVNTYPEGIPVPSSDCPFDIAEMIAFKHQLAKFQDSGYVPEGYCVLPDEWHDRQYLPYEDITVGRTSSILHIQLNPLVWLPHARDWAQGLYLLEAISALPDRMTYI